MDKNEYIKLLPKEFKGKHPKKAIYLTNEQIKNISSEDKYRLRMKYDLNFRRNQMKIHSQKSIKSNMIFSPQPMSRK